MAETTVKKTEVNVEQFINGFETDEVRRDCSAIAALMEKVTGDKPRMWGASIVGFGNYHYKYDSGREGDTFLTGFSPRKQNLTLYIMSGFDRYDELLGKLGKHTTGKSCLYIKKLADVDLAVLEELVADSVAHLKSKDAAA